MSKRYPGGILRKTPPTPSQTSAQGIWDMASVTQAVKENTWPIAGVPDPISKSLRFRSSASAYLNRTPASTGNRQKFTISVWYKAGKIGVDPVNANIINAGGDGSSLLIAGTGAFGATYNDRLLFREAGTTLFYWPMVFRDPSAWYHIVFAMDTTQATAANRAKLYVNGVDQGAFSGTAITQNTSTSINNTVAHYINTFNGTFYPSDLYYAEYNFIDGQQLTASSFGSTNDQTGVWQPIAYTGTYGTNGFYLPFSNTASTTTLGYDYSGNSNNWTTNNISLTSGSTYDSMVDVPTQWIPYNTAGDTGALFRGNYCVLSPVDIPTTGSPATLSDGNLKCVTPSSGYGFTTGTIATSSGKWYWEYLATAGAPNLSLGFGLTTCARTYGGDTGSYIYYTDGKTYANAGAGVTYGATWTNGDVIAVALDLDAGTAVFYKNGVSQGTAFTGLSGTFFPIFSDQSPSISNTFTVNFGQRPFSYTPPSGFKTLNTTNLSTPTIGATASTTANKYFNANLYTGNGTTNAITNVGFQPDFVWVKSRSDAYFHGLYDAVRGAGSTKGLYSNDTVAEGTYSAFQNLVSFDSNGFTLGATSNTNNINANTSTFVGWNWKANGAGSTNTAGSITSTVSANTTAGFSIVTYTGTGANATVGHGLGVAPSMIIVKNRTSGTTDVWLVRHSALVGNDKYIILNRTDPEGSLTTAWNNTAPTSSVFSLGTLGDVNRSTNTYVAYCFAQVAGYSAFGSYTGNGSSDGPFVFTGFRPRYVLIKASSRVDDWKLIDTARDPYNLSTQKLYPNLSAAENGSSGETSSTNTMDILSNGFKLRTSNSGTNNSGDTYIYMAFAEAPFKYALAR